MAGQKRQVCERCLRPQSACICRWVQPVAQSVAVLILQHPLEVNNAKGSARLLHMSLQGSRMVTGETFDASLLADSLRQDVLLYPESPEDLALGLPSPPALQPEMLADVSRLRLVVIDGTWRKSRKMLYNNPFLQQMPRLSLKDMPPSNYRIRKAHQQDQLSTLEATCMALMQLAQEPDRFRPLLGAFDGFVAQQMAFRAVKTAEKGLFSE